MAYTTINKSTDYFNTTVYTGNGSSQTLTMDNIGLLWMKRRDSSIRHCLFDSVRGGYYTGSGDKPLLESNSTSAAQGTDIDSAAKGITFGATQTVIGNDSAGYSYNTNGHSMVGWQWRASGAGSTNYDGSVASTVSANTTNGFSIVKWTGTGSDLTVGHGLGVAPDVVIVKNYDNGGMNWVLRHPSLGNSSILKLNTNETPFSNTNYIVPTATTFSGKAATALSTNNEKCIAYCFAEKTGYSRFGSYTGNGNTDGTFIYTGFKPAWIMGKRYDNTNNWYLFDTVRDPFNLTTKKLRPDTDAAENDNSSKAIDIVSNGFKIKNSDGEFNASGGTYVYMAFAKAPLVGTNNIPATAR